MHMARTEGVRGMMKGNWTNCVRIVPNSAMKFFTFEQLCRCVAASSCRRAGACAAATDTVAVGQQAGRPSAEKQHAAQPVPAAAAGEAASVPTTAAACTHQAYPHQ